MNPGAEQSKQPQLVLASASPRRKALLTTLIPDFRILPADLVEEQGARESAQEYVLRLARDKAAAVCRKHPGAYVMGSDTVVVLDGVCLGKPGNADQAVAMLQSLSDRWHQVLTGVAVAGPGGSAEVLSVSDVRFAALPGDWIADYVARGEPMDKAGSYAIQGEAAAWIPRLEGSYSGVMGLPLFETAGLLRQFGLLS